MAFVINARLRRTKRAAGRAWRQGRLLGQSRLKRIRIDDVTDEFAFSVGPGGWHYLTALLEDHDRGVDRPGSSSFGHFFVDRDVNAVRDLNDLFDLHDGPARFDGLPRFWLGTYPWGGLLRGDVHTPGPAFGWAYDQAHDSNTGDLWGYGRTLWYRPDDDYTLANEWRLTTELYRSIKQGYRPWRSDRFPTVTLLKHPDGEQRAVMCDGHHRLAILAHLGVETVTVEIEATVEVADCHNWYYVREGHCTVEQARPFFDAFFELNGSERFARTRRRRNGRNGD